MRGRSFLVCLFLSVFSATGFAQSQQVRNSPNPLEDILQKAGARVQQYMDTILSVVCTEVAQQQELESDLKTAKKKPTELVYDFIILRPQPSAGLREQRDLKLIDGNSVEKDTQPAIPDPNAYTTMLLILLDRLQASSIFTYVGSGDLDGQKAFIVDYVPAKRLTPKATWDGKLFLFVFQRKGRIWIDAVTYDVLRIDAQLIEPFEFQSPRTNRKGPFFTFGGSRKSKVERWDVSVRFRAQSFPGSEQPLLLPVSAESLRIVQGLRIPRLRTTHSFSDYRRFTSEIKIQQ